MPSRALKRWLTDGQRALDELEAAHRAIGGVGPGRRYATQQINQAYVVLLCSQFQRFCRDLHSEAADYLASDPLPNVRYALLGLRLIEGRKLDVGNPSPGNIGSDFGRLGLRFWQAVGNLDARNIKRQAALESLNTWRNAIAHQDFDPAKLGGRVHIQLSSVRVWRAACKALATSFDEVVRTHLSAILGKTPW